jgi:hypothetical protein
LAVSLACPPVRIGTILVSDQIPLDRYSDSDLTPIINWQYAPSLTGSRYQYKYFDLQMRANTYFSNLHPGQEISHAYRSHTFQSTTDQVLAIFYRKDPAFGSSPKTIVIIRGPGEYF